MNGYLITMHSFPFFLPSCLAGEEDVVEAKMICGNLGLCEGRLSREWNEAGMDGWSPEAREGRVKSVSSPRYGWILNLFDHGEGPVKSTASGVVVRT